MRRYYNYAVKKAVTVKNLSTIESLTVGPDFSYPTEEHSFFELVFIESGSLLCTLRDTEVLLGAGELLVIKPDTRHSYSATDAAESSVFILCFHSASASLGILDRKITLDNDNTIIFSEIIDEAKKAFAFPFKRKIKPLSDPSFGAQQLVIVKLEEVLIRLVRAELNESSFIRPVKSSIELENNLVFDVISLLNQRVYSKITLDEISAQLFYSKTYLNALFKRSTGKTIMNYYNALKIKEAKKLLTSGKSTSAVASALSFESTSYFIKFFRRSVGVTPTAFKKRTVRQ